MKKVWLKKILLTAVIIWGTLVVTSTFQAIIFNPKGVCGEMVTVAIHRLSGNPYVFSSTCIPKNWIPLRGL